MTLALAECKQQVTSYEESVSTARDKVTKISGSLNQYLKTQPKIKDSSVFVANDRYMARLSVLPQQLMGKFQDQKEAEGI